jgi:site-specific DNA-methyltransferase (adenine-specific)
MDTRCQVIHGDSREVLKTLAENSIDSAVTDPPYALVFIVKRFGKPNAAPAKGNDAYVRASSGFMGQAWDTGETAFDPDFWREVLRVLKPGAHLVAFSGTRTYHRMACAIEDAGFEIRDQLQWLYGSGFPKSHNARDGWGTALKPAAEPIAFARKPLSEKTIAANVLRWGTGALNIDGCRVEGAPRTTHASGNYRTRNDGPTMHEGFSVGEYASPAARWPANVIHDGSDEVVGCFPETAATGSRSAESKGRWSDAESPIVGCGGTNAKGTEYSGDSGSAARFFYTAKADAEDRLGSKHPTVKPVDLMQWLVRLVTPPKGLVLDPFAGTGTTGEAAFREGMRSILIEREERFVADIYRRVELMAAGPFERAGKIAKQEAAESLPLFAA